MQGSLALTGAGHATPKAVMLGLLGLEPETLDPDTADRDVASLEDSRELSLPDGRRIPFDPAADIVFAYDVLPALHPNGMRLRAFGADGGVLSDETWYSTGGGFIATERQLQRPVEDDILPVGPSVPHPFGSAEELLALSAAQGASIDEIILANEDAMRPRTDTEAALDRIAEVMLACVARGLAREGTLPGGLKVRRRAPGLWKKLQEAPQSNEREQLFDWLNVYAMAVNEENASGGQVVTAPTNGAAGIIPAVIRHYCADAEDKTERLRRFLLTAGGIGLLYKQRASISGAEMGCQGEVGVACSMAAAGLAAVWGAKPAAGVQCGRDRHGAQSRPDMRPGWRTGSDPVYRTQCHRGGKSGQCGTSGAPLCRKNPCHTRSGYRDDAADRHGHVVQIQGNESGRPCRERNRMLSVLSES